MVKQYGAILRSQVRCGQRSDVGSSEEAASEPGRVLGQHQISEVKGQWVVIRSC